MRKFFQRLRKEDKGAAMVEYALLVAGVALICAGSVSVFGHKTNDLIATTAVTIPGAHLDDNNPINSGHIIETAVQANGSIGVDQPGVIANNGLDRIDLNIGASTGATDSVLVTEP
jgi:Flp pilus assembly pilin Flp